MWILLATLLFVPAFCQDSQCRSTSVATKEVYTSSGVTAYYVQNVFVDQTSEYIHGYITFTNGTSACTLMKKSGQDLNWNLDWSKVYMASIPKFNADFVESESWIIGAYFEPSKDSQIVKVKGSDGSVIKTVSNSMCKISSYVHSIVVQSKSNQHYLFQNCQSDGTLRSRVCKISLADYGATCVTTSDITKDSFGMALLNDPQVFLTGSNGNLASVIFFKAIDFGTASMVWESKMVCPDTNCPNFRPVSIHIPSVDLIIFTMIFKTSDKLAILEIDDQNGLSKSGSTPIIFADCLSCCSNFEHEGYAYIMAWCSYGSMICKYDYTNHLVVSVKHSISSDIALYQAKMHKTTDGLYRMIMGGRLTPIDSYLLYSSFETLQYTEDFIQNSTTLYTKLEPSDTTYQIVAGLTSTFAFYGPTLNVETPTTSSDFTRDFTPGIVFSRKIYYNFDTEMFTLTENAEGEIKLNLTRACDSSSVISNNMVNNSPYPYPSWITFDSSASTITFNSPASDDANYSVAIDTLASGMATSQKKLLYFSVQKCNVQNCKKCSATDTSKCEECKIYYEGDACTEVNLNEAQAVATAATTVQATSVALVAISSAVSVNSPVLVWVIINHLQILTLLIFMKAYVPSEVVEYLTSSGFSFFQAKSLDLHILNSAEEWFEEGKPDDRLQILGYDSASAFKNHFGIIVILLMVIVLHLCVCLCCRPFCRDEGKCKCLKKIFACW
ncbi:unnamed protein product [Moneuplotes crassus]|uniref:SbsA Ig-like domain-containing protein n=1 Tax=Euplotes crassus TaxID=5936 RepID=A0AAD1XPP6_EUPCR|nr:unnamed protein product [Moneuplotes crassus]